jgi:hypothetical protein
MRQTPFAAIITMALGCTVAATQGSNATQPVPAQTRTAPAAAITVVGCVLPDEGGAAEAPGTTGVTASRANATYVLTNVTVGAATAGTGAGVQTGTNAGQTATGARQTGPATTPAGRAPASTDTRTTAHPSARYTLEGHDMTQYAAQQVEVTGTVVETPATRGGQNAAPGAKPSESAGQWIRVTDVRRINTTCPAQP